MNLNWSPDDSSSFIKDDESEADANTDGQNAADGELDRPSRNNGLLAIDDSDFEALIEILGTTGVENKEKERSRNGALNSQRAIQSTPQHRRHDAVAPAVASPALRPNGVPSSGSKNEGPRQQAVELMRPSSSDARAMKETYMPPKSRSSAPTLMSAPKQTQPPLQAMSRGSSPGPSRPPGNPNIQQGTRANISLGFTQSKQLLGTSITDVQTQVLDLRTRIQALKDQAKEFAPHIYKRAFDTPDVQTQYEPQWNQRPPQDARYANAKGKGKAVPEPSQVLNGGPRESELEIISSLTEDEAKNALDNICQILCINPSKLVGSSAQTQHEGPNPAIPPSSLPDVVRALRLVSDLDELVWRNTNKQSGPSHNDGGNIYGEENARAILDRVRLWERTVRSRAARRPGK